MKKFICRLLTLVVAFVAMDYVCGFACAYMASHAKGGATKRFDDIVNHITDDVIIFGSSRCIHHYDPLVMEDTLHMTVYNCGMDGEGIVYFYGIYSALNERYPPKAVLYDVTPEYDISRDTFYKEFANLKRFYYKACIQEIYKHVSMQDYYVTKLKMYRYNNSLFRLIGDNVGVGFYPYSKGYSPLSNELDIDLPDVIEKSAKPANEICMEYLERLILDCQGKTQLIFLISPQWHNADDDDAAPIKALCAKYDVPLLNHYCDSSYNFDRTQFRDVTHLNGNGAEKYSAEIAAEIREVLRERGVIAAE